MGASFVVSDSDQVFLLPPDTRDWLPRRHLAWEIRELVAGFDLSGFLAEYRVDGRSRPAYHPAVMVALLLYCHCKGIRSSRAVETACYDDVGCRVITGNRQPDHATIARFVKRHRAGVRGLFVQGLVACARDGLVTVDLIAGDGTKVKANASLAANVTGEQLQIEIAELEGLLAAEVDEWLAQAEAADAAEDALFGDRGDSDGGDDGEGGAETRPLPTPLRRTADTLIRRQAAKARLAERAAQDPGDAEHRDRIQRERARLTAREQTLHELTAAQQARLDDHRRRQAAARAAGGRGADGRVPVPVQRSKQIQRAAAALANARRRLHKALTGQPNRKQHKINKTDPGSRVMLGKQGAYLQAHNAQIVANRHQIILAIGTHDNPTDVAALHPILAQTRANLDAAGVHHRIGAALFDAGYASARNFTAPCEPTLYVAVTNEARQTGRRPDGEVPIGKQGWEQMTARMNSPDGKKLYRHRAAIIEPVFAQLFQRFGRNLNHRDRAVDTELHLWATTHNLLKLIRHRHNNAMNPNPAPSTA